MSRASDRSDGARGWIPAVRFLGCFVLIAAGSLMLENARAIPITVTSTNEPYGTVSEHVVTTGSAPITNPLPAGLISAMTAQGALKAYCVDIFHFTGSNVTYGVGAMSGNSYVTGQGSPGTTVAWTSRQVQLITALLQDGALQVQNQLDTASIQIAIWEVEYATELSNGTYDLVDANNDAASFYFQGPSDSVLTLAQSYLNNATGKTGTGGFAPTWIASNASQVFELTSNGNQDLIFLSPEPASLATFLAGLAGLAMARWRQGIR